MKYSGKLLKVPGSYKLKLLSLKYTPFNKRVD